jgi:hypothetical protein
LIAPVNNQMHGYNGVLRSKPGHTLLLAAR